MGRYHTGRAGREQRRAEELARYGTALAQMLLNLLRPASSARILHIGSPGAARLAEHLAYRLDSGELVVCVYTFDELEETRAALAGLGNVHVINELDDLDEDEPPFDLVSCIAPYHLGRDTVLHELEQGMARLAEGGTLYLAGDRQHELERYVEHLRRLAHEVSEVAGQGQYRIVAARGRRARGSLHAR